MKIKEPILSVNISDSQNSETRGPLLTMKHDLQRSLSMEPENIFVSGDVVVHKEYPERPLYGRHLNAREYGT